MDEVKQPTGLIEIMGFRAQVIDLPQGAAFTLGPIGAVVTSAPARLEPGCMLMILDPGIAEKIRAQVKTGRGGMLNLNLSAAPSAINVVGPKPV